MSPAVMLRPVGWGDFWRLRAWRNDPSTRRMMGDRRRVGVIRHARWLWQVQAPQTAVRAWVALSAQPGPEWPLVPVGTGGYTVEAQTATLSVTVAPAYRGQGLAVPIIEELVTEARRAGCTVCVADIRSENAASLQAFLQAGFMGRYQNAERDMIRLDRPC